MVIPKDKETKHNKDQMLIHKDTRSMKIQKIKTEYANLMWGTVK